MSKIKLSTEQEFQLVKEESQFKTLSCAEKTEIYIKMRRLSMAKENFLIDSLKGNNQNCHIE